MGEGTTEIFSLETLTWRAGPLTPYFNDASAAQLEDTFLVVGGRDGAGVYLDTIYEFDNVDYRWTLRSQRLADPMIFPGVVAVPGEKITC